MRVFTLMVLAGLLVCSKSLAASRVAVINDVQKTHECLVMSDLTTIKLPETDGIQMPGLVLLSEKAKSPLMLYANTGGGLLAIYGSDQVAFATNSTVQAILALPPKEIDRLISTNKPMPMAEFVDKIQNKLPTLMPSVPVQMMPSACQVFLKTKPSNLILCKAYDQVFVIVLGDVTDGGKALHVAVHRFQ